MLAKAGGVIDPKKIPLIKFDHHAKFSYCFLYRVRVCMRTPKFGDAGAPPLAMERG